MSSLLFGLFLLVLVLAPLPLGSNREWSWTLLALLLGALTAAWSLQGLLSPRRVNTRLPPLLIILFLGVCAWAALQAAGWTPPGWHHPLWSMSAETLDADLAGSISLSRDDSLNAMLRLLSYGLAFFLAFQFCGDAERARRLFQVLAGIGLVCAVYGLGMYFSGRDGFLFFWDMDYRRSVHGTFVNRNHFATWLGLCVLALVALTYQGLARPRRNPVYELPLAREERLEAFLARAWLPLAMLILMTGALILTHSRGGFLGTLAGGVVMLLALHHRRPIGTPRSRAVLGAVLVVVLAVFLITSQVLMQRMDQSTAGLEGRLQAFELAGEGIGDNPLLGFGYGTFADSFRLYRDEALEGFFDKTHNTYLENLFELGWPAGLVLFACVAWLGLICLQGLRTRGRDWVFPATGLAALVLVATHALVDFSLQIPATAVTFAALMGAACAQSYSSRR
jgi:O-antigen ligase